MHSLEISDGLATVGPAFRLGELCAGLAQYEVTIPGGCGATVGIGGQELGGGLGLLGRSRGLTSEIASKPSDRLEPSTPYHGRFGLLLCDVGKARPSWHSARDQYGRPVFARGTAAVVSFSNSDQSGES
jgi:hypothetical protein